MMNVQPTQAFKEYLQSIGITEPIFADRERPTTGLPSCFIDVMQNGLVYSATEQASILKCAVMVVVYVKLLSTDVANIGKEQEILGKMTDFLSREVVSVGKYHFKLSTLSSTRNITSGYSSVPMNVDCQIY